MKPGQKMSQPFGTSYYIAPEVLYTNYDEKWDWWSIGVIMYILLWGKPPFEGETDKEIWKKVRDGRYTMEGGQWEEVTDEAKDLIKKLMTYDPKRRISWSEALSHPWFLSQISEEGDTANTITALENLRDFKTTKKLQQAAIAFIVSQLASKEQMHDLQKAFKHLDVNKTGVLTKEELKIGYKEFIGDGAEEEVDRIMLMADTDKSGAIDYSEWVVATISKKELLSDEKLRQAFDLFDGDGGGSISSWEIKEVLGIGKTFDERIWGEIISEVDINGDGEISYEEFKAMMSKLLTDENLGGRVTQEDEEEKILKEVEKDL